ncbi:response regulator [Mariprofundus erugo]|uniref:Response regulator n=1 Tax=Mariprofundus erugo TaxID=2528639 RepID=A0A5R9GKT9_9PROT|nr:response regulator [Mariprofundus erugo]TLS65639.1 response regulator [Mariprofundus erugo]TLS75664.1 response regulator [Mariprofundus erugo]
MSTGEQAIEILLVEDSPGDVRLTVEAFKDMKLHNKLSVASDGVEALQFLRREGAYADASRPDIIILDLNLPRLDGRQVLAEIKADERLKHIPVIILTSSSADEDIAHTYKLHANCFITKPISFEEFTRVITTVNDFWLSIVKLPPRDHLQGG